MVKNVPVNKITKLNFTVLIIQILCILDTYNLRNKAQQDALFSLNLFQ